MIFAVSIFISYLFSPEKEEAFLGTYGWYLGLRTYILLFILYILFSHFYVWRKWDIISFLAGSFIVTLLAVLNRIGILLIDSEGYISTFISTIGNINWLAGYLSLVFPLGIGAYVGDLFESRTADILQVIYIVTGCFGILTNGSNSLYLSLIAVTFFLFACGMTEKKIMKRVLTVMISFWSACLVLHICYLRMPAASFYALIGDQYNLLIYVLRNNISLILTFTIALLYFVNARADRKKMANDLIVSRLFKGLLLLGMLVIAVLLVIQLTDYNPFPDSFGNNRGFIWKLCAGFYQKYSAQRKIIGIGPDCFASYSMLDWDFMMKLMEQYPGVRLVTAHSEPLTMLLNNGAVGVISYFSAMFMHIWPLTDVRLSKVKYQLPAVLAVVSYQSNLLVSFHTIMTLPFLYMLLSYMAFIAHKFNKNDEI